MSVWATNRQRLLIAIGISLIVAAAVILLVPILYETPSCSDGRKNQDEEGIDCGGSCAYFCADVARAPSVRFVQGLVQGERTDAVAYIDNRNSNAAVRGARYTVELYDAQRVPIGTKSGEVDLPPASTVPVFVPGVVAGPTVVAQAFLTFEDEPLRWFKETEKPAVPSVVETRIEDGPTPRIIATLGNPLPRPMVNTKVVTTVFGAGGNVIAASQTIVPFIAAQDSATATFTWNTPFSDVPARIDILPSPAVPAP